MKKQIVSFLILAIALSACEAAVPTLPAPFPKIDRQPAAFVFNRGDLDTLQSAYDSYILEYDLRSYDLSGLDLKGSLEELSLASFDDQTLWPPQEYLPSDFDWQQIMEWNKTPGLDIRSLHDQGINGQGVGIAIIDQKLLVDHEEYADQLQLYEEAEDILGGRAHVHAPAVASIAVGKTIGVAPGADLYYIATQESHDLSFFAWSIRRILEINEQLPAERKIRVISISYGWQPDFPGYDELNVVLEEAKAAGMLIVSSNLEEVRGFKFHGLGRDPLGDPNDFEKNEPGYWWGDDYLKCRECFADRLLIPMSSRTVASPTGISDYSFSRLGGWSWSIPYIAGVYALAVQIDPTVTPEQFWTIAMETGQVIQLPPNGESVPLGPIIDPVALIAALQNK